jgi:hypothetical protein
MQMDKVEDSMTYKLSWLVPGRLIELTPPDIYSDETIQNLDIDMKALFDTASQPVHILIDAGAMKTYPSALESMKLTYYRHPRMGRLLVVGLTKNPLLRFLGSVVGRGVGIQIKDFATREEALAYFESVEQM